MKTDLLIKKIEFALLTRLKYSDANICLIGTAETVYFKLESQTNSADDIITTIPAAVIRNWTEIPTESVLFKLCQNYYKERNLLT